MMKSVRNSALSGMHGRMVGAAGAFTALAYINDQLALAALQALVTKLYMHQTSGSCHAGGGTPKYLKRIHLRISYMVMDWAHPTSRRMRVRTCCACTDLQYLRVAHPTSMTPTPTCTCSVRPCSEAYITGEPSCDTLIHERRQQRQCISPGSWSDSVAVADSVAVHVPQIQWQ